MTVTFPKVFYTLILIAVIVAFILELYRVWFDPQLYVRPFGEHDDADAQKFAQSIVHHYAELRHKFTIADNSATLGSDELEPWESRFRRALRPGTRQTGHKCSSHSGGSSSEYRISHAGWF